MSKTFGDIVKSIGVLCVKRKLVAPIYAVSKQTGRLTVCKSAYLVRRAYSPPENRLSLSVMNNVLFEVNTKEQRNSAALIRKGENGKELHRLFINKKDAVEYANSILSERINYLRKEMFKNTIL